MAGGHARQRQRLDEVQLLEEPRSLGVYEYE